MPLLLTLARCSVEMRLRLSQSGNGPACTEVALTGHEKLLGGELGDDLAAGCGDGRRLHFVRFKSPSPSHQRWRCAGRGNLGEPRISLELALKRLAPGVDPLAEARIMHCLNEEAHDGATKARSEPFHRLQLGEVPLGSVREGERTRSSVAASN
jgi:hypothetical protein